MSNVVNLDVAKRVDIICRKGDTFKLEIDLTAADGTPVPVNSYNYHMEVRVADYSNTGYDSPSAGSGDTNTDIILSTKDDANGTKLITYQQSVGKVIFKVSNTNMKLVTAGLYVYDIEAIATANSESQTWMYGTFKVNEDITV
jgi:hypothetical protein